jgi:cytochrome P450
MIKTITNHFSCQALLRPTFAKTQLKDFDKLETHVMKLISQVPRNGGTVELQSLFQTLTLHAGLDYLLGQNDESELAQKEQERFSENLHNAVFEAGRRAKIGVFRLLDPIVRPIKFASYLVACRELHQYVDRIIHVRLSATEKQKSTKSRDTQSSEDHEKKEYVFLDHLAEATQDRKQLRWELASTISGARDTTAGLMAHIFWELARRPDIWLRLKQETEALGNEKPEPEMLETMVYLKAIIYECE